MYGADNSDDIWLLLSCEPGNEGLRLSQPATEPGPILLESGGDTESYPTTPEPSALHDLLLTARAKADDPVFLRFRRLGWLATWATGERLMMAPQPGSADRVEGFFAACEAG